MNNKTIILVNGKKRAGKDFFSDKVISQGFTKIAVAFKLKEFACEIANIEYAEMEDLKNEGLSFKVDSDFNIAFKESLIAHYNYMKYDDATIMDNIEAFDVDRLPIWVGDAQKDAQVDARLFLQYMNIFKEIFFEPDIWINYTVDKIKETPGNIIISDFRFPNEFSCIKDEFDNTYTVKVIGKNFYEHDEYDSHVSERSLDSFEFDYHINNTIWDEISLNAQLKGLLREINND